MGAYPQGACARHVCPLIHAESGTDFPESRPACAQSVPKSAGPAPESVPNSALPGLRVPKPACRTHFCGVPKSAMTRVRPRARAKRTQFCEALEARVTAKRTYFCVDESGAVDVSIDAPAQSRYVYAKLVPTRIETVVAGPCASRTRFCGVVTYTSSGDLPREILRIRAPYPFLRPDEIQKRTHFCATDLGRHRIREIDSPSTRFCGDNRCAQTRGGITVRVNC